MENTVIIFKWVNDVSVKYVHGKLNCYLKNDDMKHNFSTLLAH